MSVELIQNYSGVVLNQNITPTGSISVTDGLKRYQEFFLPSDFRRGTSGEELVTPQLSGWQILCNVTDSSIAKIEWTLEYDLFGTGWLNLASGTTTGAQAEASHVWMDMLFDNPVDINETVRTARLRFGFKADAGISAVYDVHPNPIALLGSVKAYQANGTTVIQASGFDIAFNFRVLGLVADNGTDFLGNLYRSVAKAADASNLDGDQIWMSKPNPSRFAVESLYFDVRPQSAATYTQVTPGIFVQDPSSLDDDTVVIDSVIVDPVTPGVYFSVYYSVDGDSPGSTDDEWDQKLWIRVPKTFHLTKKETFNLPKPIIAKYMKIEFTHLQVQSYQAGQFAKPIIYKKHPKWVLDYFLLRLNAQQALESGIIGGAHTVIYDAYDLAYNYYLDDINQAPDTPIEANSSFTQTVNTFLSASNDVSDQIDPIMLNKISLALQPYQSDPSVFSSGDTLIGTYTKQSVTRTVLANYPVETNSNPNVQNFADTTGLQNQTVIFENDYPVMFFYIDCRHTYREILGSFEFDKAYFVGINQVAFTRDQYQVAFDLDQYNEPAGDLINAERNDFILSDGVMTINGS